jgi:hypothetical protein
MHGQQNIKLQYNNVRTTSDYLSAVTTQNNNNNNNNLLTEIGLSPGGSD